MYVSILWNPRGIDLVNFLDVEVAKSYYYFIKKQSKINVQDYLKKTRINWKMVMVLIVNIFNCKE